MDKSCKKHKRTVEKYDGDLKQLAEDLGDLHYKELRNFLVHLADKLEKDGWADKERGRPKLSHHLLEASLSLIEASSDIDEAWEISKPYMEE